ncbi:MAG TPA: PAS domain-containing protein [Burkholderiaceae bacterium]|jgi:diguanylate cyclase (GGDEF)-like protein/PAS domain S-box-containing protein
MSFSSDERAESAPVPGLGLAAHVAIIAASSVLAATLLSCASLYVFTGAGAGADGGAISRHAFALLAIAAVAAVVAGFIVHHVARRRLMPLRALRQSLDHAVEEVQGGHSKPEKASKNVDDLGALPLSWARLQQQRLEPEAKTRASEAAHRAAIDAGGDAFFIFERVDGGNQGEAEFRVAYANSHAADFSRQAAASLRGCGPAEILPAGASIDLHLKLMQAHQLRKVMVEEIDIAPPGAASHWLLCQCIPLADLAKEGIALVLRDINRRKAEEAEARESRAFLHSLIEYLPVLIFAKSFRPGNADKMVAWNRSAEHIMGYSADQVIGKSNHEIFPSKVADTLNALDRQMLAQPKVVTIPEFPYRRPDGALVYLRSISVPLFGDDGRVDYILGIVEDITARREQEWKVRSQQAELAAINDSLPVGLFRTDTDDRLVYVNPTFEKMAGMDFDTLARRGWHATIHPEDRDKILKEWTHAMHHDLPYRNTLRFQSSNGDVSWASLKAAQVRIDGKVRGYVGSVDDVTARLQAEQDVLKGERWLRTIADNLPALIAYVDKNRRYRFTNVHYEKLFERDGAKVMGSNVSDVFGGEYYTFTSDRIDAALRGERVCFEREGTDRTGRKRHWRVEYIPDRQDGDVAGFYSMVLDITESKELENRLRTLARIDSLTGLANRSYFNEKLAQALAEVDGMGLQLAVLFLDIDRFKAFNDNFGHQGGDTVLREFARRLTACVRSTDTVARLAGDEFVILLLGSNMGCEAEVVARKIMAEMEREFSILDGTVRVTTSIGITLKRDAEVDPELLLHRADQALYAAKSAGRNGFTTFL